MKKIWMVGWIKIYMDGQKDEKIDGWLKNI